MTMQGVFLTIAALAAIVIVGLVFVYNELVAMRQRTRQAWADIDVQLNQRRDLLPNLVETVQGYAMHEKETLQAVMQARSRAVAAENPSARAQAETRLSGALVNLFAVAEAYPDLKANENFTRLQEQIEDVEAKISAARRFFNNAAAEYNGACEGFPGFVLAEQFGFKPVEFFEIGAEERASALRPPPVSFKDRP